MDRNKLCLWLILLGVLPLVCSGCFGTSKEFKEVKGEVLKSLDTSVEEGASFGLGRVSLGLAGCVLSFVPDEDVLIAKDLIRLVRRVEVAMYELEDAGDANRLEILREIDPKMLEAGLEPIIRHVDQNEMVTIYIDVDEDKIRQLFVVVLDGSELIMVRVHGKLEEAVVLALEQADIDFVGI